MIFDNDFENKFNDATPDIINQYIDVYKDLDKDKMLLFDDITRKISHNKNNFQKILDGIMKASLEIEYYEGCEEITKIQNKWKI